MQQQLHSQCCDKNRKFNSHHPATNLGVVSPCLQSLKHARTFSILPPFLLLLHSPLQSTIMLLLSHMPVHYGCTGLLALCWPFTRHSKCFARLVQLTRHRCSSFGALAAGSPANLTCSCIHITQSFTHLCLLA